MRLAEHNLIDTGPPTLGDLQQLFREVAHEEPGDRFLRAGHDDADAAVREADAMLRRGCAPFATGMDEDGGVDVGKGPGGRLDGKSHSRPSAIIHVPAVTNFKVLMESKGSARCEAGA